MIQVLDETGRQLDEYLLVRYGATAQDWEESSDEKRFVEFIDGKLIMHSPVSFTHTRVFGFLHRLLGDYVEQRNLGVVLTGPLAMDLSPDRKFEPDLLFVSMETAKNIREDRLLGPGDLAIEIASPSTRSYDRQEKRECYRVAGVREYWMIDPYDRKVIVDRPAGHEVATRSAGRVASEACPAFWVKAEWFWENPAPNVKRCLIEILGGSE